MPEVLRLQREPSNPGPLRPWLPQTSLELNDFGVLRGAIQMSWVLISFDNASPLAIVFLDGCRDPLSKDAARTTAFKRAVIGCQPTGTLLSPNC